MKKIINVILIVILIISGISIYKTFNSYRNDRLAYKKLQENFDKINYEDELRNINNEYKFWIKINDTNVNYPVVQGGDNEKYLNTNFNLLESRSGSIFIDYRNDIEKDKNLILYGHNMRDKSMFENINKFKEKENFDNGQIRIISEGKEEKYEIFSVFVVNGDFNNLKTSFATEEEFREYVEYMSSLSLHTRDITQTEKLITLFTCSYEFDNARTVVVAKK